MNDKQRITNIHDSEPPKIFWKYYDNYRRKIISIVDFSTLTQIPLDELRQFITSV